MKRPRHWRVFGVLTVLAIPVALGALHQNPPRDAPAKLPAGTASISGVVLTDDSSPAPVRRARVLAQKDATGNGFAATTDDDGRFVIRGLPAGQYSVHASKPAWLGADYGASRPGREGTQIVVADGQQVVDVRLRMSRGAVLTGIVLDRSGEPVPTVGVSALRYSFSEATGEKVPSRVLSDAITDDQGVYRLFGLAAGDYLIVATLRSGAPTALMDLRRVTPDEVAQALASPRPGTPAPAPPAASQGRPQLVGYAPVYFPGTTDVSQATSVKVAASEEKGGLNIRLDVVPTARVDAVPSFPDNANRQSAQIYLIAQQPTISGASGMTIGRRDPDGRVIFNGVTPGSYTVIARAALSGTAPAPSAAPAGGRGAAGPLGPLVLYASVDLTVEGKDVVVAVDLKPGMTVSGHVMFENPDRAPKDPALRVFLEPVRSGSALSVSPARAEGTGAFKFEGVPPGRYRVGYSSPSLADWGLISATLRGREILDAPLDIRAGEDVTELVLHFTDKPSELAGHLQTSAGQPATSYFVIVFSAAREFWTPMSRRVRSLRPATDGSFSVDGLPAGDYYIAAVTDVERGEWYDPAFLAQLVGSSAKVTIRDGQKTTQDLMIK